MTLRLLSLALVLATGCTPRAPDAPAAAPMAPARSADVPDLPPGAVPGDPLVGRAFFEGTWSSVGWLGADGFLTVRGDGVGVGDVRYRPRLTNDACEPAMVVQFDATDVFCVESNQAFIVAQWRYDPERDQATLHYVGTHDLGAGGQQLPWGEVDAEVPLATLVPELGEGRTVSLLWHGVRTRKGETFPEYGDWRAGEYEPAPGAPDAR